MGTARRIALTLKRDDYDISTRNAVIMALQEDLYYSEEEAVGIADEVVRESKGL